MIGGVSGLRLRPARPLLLCGWLTLLEVPLFAFFALGYGTPALICAAVLCGISAALVNVLWETTLQEQIPPEALSRVSAFDWMGSLAFYPLGMIIAGPIAAVIGVAGSFTVASGRHGRLGGAADRAARHQAGAPRPAGAGRTRAPRTAPPVGSSWASAQTGLPVSSHSR